MIRDLEAMTLDITSNEDLSLIREAILCSYNSCYRSSVVMASVACFDSLFRKVEEIVDSGGLDKGSLVIFDTVSKKKKNQDSFESELTELAKSVGFISPSECKKLHLIRDVRNLCAHASGHASSPEESRDVIASVIDIVLSREALGGIASVCLLITKISMGGFFPPQIKESCDVVRRELNNISNASYVALGHKIARIISDEEHSGDIVDDFVEFLVCLCELSPDTRRVVLKMVNGDVFHGKVKGFGFVVRFLSINPDMLNSMDDIARARFIAALNERIKSGGVDEYVSVLMKGLAGVLSAGDLNYIYRPIKECNVLEDNALRRAVLQCNKLANEDLANELADRILTHVEVDQWTVSNPLVKGFSLFDFCLLDDFVNMRFVRYCCNTDAYAAKGLIQNKFNNNLDLVVSALRGWKPATKRGEDLNFLRISLGLLIGDEDGDGNENEGIGKGLIGIEPKSYSGLVSDILKRQPNLMELFLDDKRFRHFIDDDWLDWSGILECFVGCLSGGDLSLDEYDARVYALLSMGYDEFVSDVMDKDSWIKLFDYIPEEYRFLAKKAIDGLDVSS